MSLGRFLLFFAVSLLSVRAMGDGLYGPVLGMLPDVAANTMRPIRGIPGAASIGDPVDLGERVDGIALVPRRNAALITTGSGMRTAALEPDGTVTTADAGLPAGFRPDVVAFSPNGAVAALYDSSGNGLWLKAGGVTRRDLVGIAGSIEMLAVGESADTPVAGTVRGGRQSVFVLDAAGRSQRISGFGEVTDLTFLGSTGDLAIADGGAKRVLLVRDPLSGNAAREVVLALPGAPDVPFRIASSGDGRMLAVLAHLGSGRRALERVPGAGARRPAERRNPVLGMLRVAGREWHPVECSCDPVGLDPLNGNAVYRLTRRIDHPLWILDADSDPPRTVFIPAVSK